MAWRKVWVWQRKLKKGNAAYCLRWHDVRGRIRTETVGPDKKLAERLRTQREAELNAGKLNEVPDVSFDEFKKTELKAMKGRMAEGSLTELEYALRKFKEVTGAKKLSQVTPALVEDYISQRLEDVRPATANKEFRTVSAAFNRAVRRGQLRENPAAGIKQIREPEREIRVLSPDEVEKLLNTCPSARWRALVALGVTTGMRLGEMLALRWKDVDVEDMVVRIRNTPDHRTKSGKHRDVPLGAEALDLLRRLGRKGEFVFHTSTGKPWDNNLQTGFRSIVERAGIEYCSLHDLRRTFISHLAMADVNAAVVKELAGHSSIVTTQKYYTRIAPEALASAQAKLPFGEAIRGACDISDTYHGPRARGKRKAARIISIDRAAS